MPRKLFQWNSFPYEIPFNGLRESWLEKKCPEEIAHIKKLLAFVISLIIFYLGFHLRGWQLSKALFHFIFLSLLLFFCVNVHVIKMHGSCDFILK